MTAAQHRRGCAPVGYVAELDRIEAASVIYLRLWSESAETRSQVWNDLATGLGRDHARKAIQSFEQLCSLCVKHGRRPLMCHSVQCKCLGSDESCFANFIATASEGEREDAMLIATLLVRPDIAPLIASLAADFGLALRKMHLNAPRAPIDTYRSSPTVH